MRETKAQIRQGLIEGVAFALNAALDIMLFTHRMQEHDPLDGLTADQLDTFRLVVEEIAGANGLCLNDDEREKFIRGLGLEPSLTDSAL
jgi:hypothetical protein